MQEKQAKNTFPGKSVANPVRHFRPFKGSVANRFSNRSIHDQLDFSA
jgi:hypothetical protein